MRTLIKIFLILCLCSPVLADTHTSIVSSGNWSTPATWDANAVPADGDAFVIANGHTITMDANQNSASFPNGMAASTITGTLQFNTTASSFNYLKMKGTLTVNGTLQRGTSVSVPYPSSCEATIAFNGNYGISVGAAGKIYDYCTQPTYKIVKLDTNVVNGSTVLPIDTDLTGDSTYWKAGNEIVICNAYSAYNTTVPQCEIRTILSVNGGADPNIVISAATTNKKSSGSWIYITKRNVRILTPSTTNVYAVSLNAATTGCTINAEINGSGTGYRGIYSGVSCTMQGVLANYTSWGTYLGTSHTLSYICAVNTGLQTGIKCTISYVAGCTSGTSSGTNNIVSYFGCNYNGTNGGTGHDCSYFEYCYYGSYTGSCFKATRYKNNYVGIFSVSSTIVNGVDFVNTIDILQGDNYVITGTLGGTTNLSQVNGGKAYNCTFSGTEFSSYNSDSYRSKRDYFESTNHNGNDNALKVYDLGGLITSQTASPPTGYTIWYLYEPESSTYPCYRQYGYTLQPGEVLIVTGKMKNIDGIDWSSNPPKAEIIDSLADPLVDSTQTALATATMPISNGDSNDWQDWSMAYTHPDPNGSPMQLLIRVSATHATADLGEVIYVPDIAAKVGTIYSKLPTNYIAGSATPDDLSVSVDANDIAYVVRLEMDANSVDFNTIIADTNEIQTDWTDGGRLDTILDSALSYILDLLDRVF